MLNNPPGGTPRIPVYLDAWRYAWARRDPLGGRALSRRAAIRASIASVCGVALLGCAASTFDRMSIAHIEGRYEGDGIWHDAAGDSMKYRVVQTNRVTAGGLAISFTHNFSDGSVVQADIALSQIALYIYSVRVGDDEIGRGYALGDMLRYHMRAGAGIVEVGYRPRGVDRLEVLGSSTTNAAGKYVAWHEKLRRTSS